MPKRRRNEILGWMGGRTREVLDLELREDLERLRAEELRVGALRGSFSSSFWITRGTATPFIPEPAPGTSVPLPRAVTGPTTRLTLEHQCPTGDVAPTDATFCPHCGARIRP